MSCWRWKFPRPRRASRARWPRSASPMPTCRRRPPTGSRAPSAPTSPNRWRRSRRSSTPPCAPRPCCRFPTPRSKLATTLRDQGDIEGARKVLLENSQYLGENAEKYNDEVLAVALCGQSGSGEEPGRTGVGEVPQGDARTTNHRRPATVVRHPQTVGSVSSKQITLLALLVCVPLAALVWLGGRLVRDERARLRRDLQDLLAKQLGDANQIVDRFFQKRQRELLRVTDLATFETGVASRDGAEPPASSAIVRARARRRDSPSAAGGAVEPVGAGVSRTSPRFPAGQGPRPRGRSSDRIRRRQRRLGSTIKPPRPRTAGTSGIGGGESI